MQMPTSTTANLFIEMAILQKKHAILLFVVLGWLFATPFAFRSTGNRIIRSRRIELLASATSASDRVALQRVAIDAVRSAGRYILAGSGTINLNDDVKSKIGSRDIVTKVDEEAQEIIKQTIAKAFPHHTFLGEEDLAPGREAGMKAINEMVDNEHLWIIDPVDGTTNFAHGQSLCGVILAYASKGKIEFGCIYDPFLNELFTAWDGQGAFLNGKRIHCCNTPEMKSSVVCTGSPPNLLSLAACLRATNLISAEVRTMRMYGSAAIMLSWLACGRVTAYFEADMNVWDLAAGASSPTDIYLMSMSVRILTIS